MGRSQFDPHLTDSTRNDKLDDEFGLQIQEDTMDSGVALDGLDRVLVRCLQADVRASYQEIAKVVGTSPSTVRRRVERLVENGAIKLVAVPAWDRLGLRLTAFIAISVDLYRLRSVGKHLAEMDEIVFVAMVTGDYDIISEVVLPRNEDFVRFVTQRIAPIEGIRNIQTFMVPEFIKSFEQYRLPAEPNRLYLRTDSGDYVHTEEDFVNGRDETISQSIMLDNGVPTVRE